MPLLAVESIKSKSSMHLSAVDSITSKLSIYGIDSIKSKSSMPRNL